LSRVVAVEVFIGIFMLFLMGSCV